MAKDVVCDVCNCTYNDHRKCQASCIEVHNCDCSKVHNSKETQCKTFKCK